jgi:hypothetical protein
MAVNEVPIEGGESPEGAAEGSPEFVLPIAFNCRGYDVHYVELKDACLSELLDSLRDSFKLDSSIILKASIAGSAVELDPDTPISVVKRELGDEKILNIHIHNLQTFSQTTVIDLKMTKVVDTHFSGPTVGTPKYAGEGVIAKADVKWVSPVHPVGGGYKLIPEDMLPLLKERAERTILLEFVFLFLGTFLGALISLLITLANPDMPLVAQGRLVGALIAALLATGLFAVMVFIVKRDRERNLRPMVDQIMGKDKPRD